MMIEDCVNVSALLKHHCWCSIRKFFDLKKPEHETNAMRDTKKAFFSDEWQRDRKFLYLFIDCGKKATIYDNIFKFGELSKSFA